MSMVDLIIISALSVLLLLSVSYTVVLKVKQDKLLNSIAQLWVDQQELLKEIDRLSSLTPDGTESSPGGFLRFLSESRDVAFKYISEVQLAINTLDFEMKRGNEEEIAKAYEELMSFLPNESPDVVK